MLAGLTGFSPYDDAVLLNIVEAGRGWGGGRLKVEGKKQRETSQGEFHVTVIFKRRLSQFFFQGCPKICLGAGWVGPDHMQGWI